MTAVMSRNVVGVKLHNSGWWGSNRKNSGGLTVLNALCTPAPTASPRARFTAAYATGWSGLNGSVSVCVISTSGANSRIVSEIRRQRVAVDLERIIAQVEALERRAEGGGGALGLAVADLLHTLDRLPLLLPQLAGLTALAVGERDHARRRHRSPS